MILLIDNYDSFSYNLYQLVGSLTDDVRVIRNDAYTVQEIASMKPSGIILSPGPGRPADAGICIETVRQLGGKIPILGVCLGHQSICEAYGATVTYAKTLMHGKQSETWLDPDCPIFRGLGEKVLTGRYHSLAAAEETLPRCLRVTARSVDGEIMAVSHTEYPVHGLQFHPESILTPGGPRMLKNWVDTLKGQ